MSTRKPTGHQLPTVPKVRIAKGPKALTSTWQQDLRPDRERDRADVKTSIKPAQQLSFGLSVTGGNLPAFQSGANAPLCLGRKKLKLQNRESGCA